MAVIQEAIMKTTLLNDLFSSAIFDGSSILATEPLKEAMEKNKITSFPFIELGYIED